ncbi:MAG: hypothetical protein SF028_02815 [Candidatus Sumerlaeia bacterium]|nr:hypothetical protein [Candidatus Sumerlaeia bacterium]
MNPAAPPTPRWKRLAAIVGAFAALNLVLWFFLHGVGDDIEWQSDLARADAAFEDGRAEDASRLIEDFARRWPGARDTFGYQEKAGRYHEAAGRHAAAAQAYDLALAIRPATKGLAARAAEMHRLAGNADRATTLFLYELSKGDAANDLALVRIGQAFLDDGELLAAFDQFGKVRDRERFAEELAEANARLRAELPELAEFDP